MDTMRLSLCRKVKEASPPPLDSSEQTGRRKDSPSTIVESTGNAKKEIDSLEMESRSETANAGEVEQVPSERITKPETESSMEIRSNAEGGGEPHFRGMRPTSWSPPPGKPKHRYKINNSDSTRSKIADEPLLKTSWSTPNSYGSSKVEIGCTETSNVYKITVSPRASPLVHRLQIGPTGLGDRGSRRTSILINGDTTRPTAAAETSPDNKVTISVGGEDSVYNPTVISVNSENPPRVKSSGEKTRTLVILDNYKSNIVVASGKEGGKEDTRSKPLLKTTETAESASEETEQRSRRNTESESTTPTETTIDCEKRATRSVMEGGRCSLVERNAKFHAGNDSRTAENSSKVASLSKEALISKLLEDSLRKARENGEILDEDSGEAILKILKQSLLKSKEYEGSESTLEANYSRASSLNSDGDFISTNLFLEENPYEVIKEPIYEEIPDEPPPLPLSPPPTEDYIKDRIYFGDIDYYRKSSSDQFLGSYLTDNVYKKSNSEDLGETYLSKSPEDFFKKMSTSPDERNISSKFELLNFLMDTKDRAISIEEEEDEDDEDEEDTEGDLEALYEQKETSLGDLSSKSSQISNVSDSSEECNIILTSSSETSKVSFYI